MKQNETMTNDDKAAFALKALTAYSKATGSGGSLASQDEIEEGVQDLLSDIMHLCGRRGVDFRSALSKAAGHFEEEVDESEEIVCAFCGVIVPVEESYSPGDDAICAKCNKDIGRGA